MLLFILIFFVIMVLSSFSELQTLSYPMDSRTILSSSTFLFYFEVSETGMKGWNSLWFESARVGLVLGIASSEILGGEIMDLSVDLLFGYLRNLIFI